MAKNKTTSTKKRRKERDQPRRNEDLTPPIKQAKFGATDDDDYIQDLHMVLGAKEKIPEWKVHLKVLDCGPRFRGHDKKEFALPHEQEQIQAMAQEMEDNARKEIKKKDEKDLDQKQGEWKFPGFHGNAKHGPGQKMGEFRRKIEVRLQTVPHGKYIARAPLASVKLAPVDLSDHTEGFESSAYTRTHQSES